MPPWNSELNTCISLSITNLSYLNNRAQRHFQNNHQVIFFNNHMVLRPVGTVTFDPSQIIQHPFLGDLDLPEVKAELLASRLKQWNLLQIGVNVCSFRTHQQSLAQFFSMKGGLGLVYCTDANGIMQE